MALTMLSVSAIQFTKAHQIQPIYVLSYVQRRRKHRHIHNAPTDLPGLQQPEPLYPEGHRFRSCRSYSAFQSASASQRNMGQEFPFFQ